MKRAVLVAQALLMVSIAGSAIHGFFSSDFALIPMISGALVCSIGTGILLAGSAALGRSFTIFVDPKSELRVAGIYRYTRNPIYLGGLLICAGWTIGLVSGLCGLLTIALAAVLNSKIRLEEIELEAKFGPRYEDYFARTARWIKLP